MSKQVEVLDTIYFIDIYYEIHSGLVTGIGYDNTKIEYIDIVTKEKGTIEMTSIFLTIKDAMNEVNKRILEVIEVKKNNINEIYNEIENLKTKMFIDYDLDTSEEKFISYFNIQYH